MFTKLAVIATISLSLLAGTGATPTPTDGGVCNTGPVQCCQQTIASNSTQATSLLGMLPIGIPISSLTGPIGIGCSPLSIVGAGSGGNCNAMPVCCQDVYAPSLVGINCVPINVQV
ncbi:fungal hydrophobin [Rickenella mellea]|uniref:Hydrophobin n=1 Tax=Rickenella mellea TaxID=50990 RepID=A0A4Y7Q276_9AGAM|nr:fungal hydrophobin [Rickenella mellea]